jgi:hypothetical protein
MPKANLRQTVIHSGTFYGPGDVDLPDDVHKDLKAKGLLDEPATPVDPAATARVIGPDMQETADAGPGVPDFSPEAGADKKGKSDK